MAAGAHMTWEMIQSGENSCQWFKVGWAPRRWGRFRLPSVSLATHGTLSRRDANPARRSGTNFDGFLSASGNVKEAFVHPQHGNGLFALD